MFKNKVSKNEIFDFYSTKSMDDIFIIPGTFYPRDIKEIKNLFFTNGRTEADWKKEFPLGYPVTSHTSEILHYIITEVANPSKLSKSDFFKNQYIYTVRDYSKYKEMKYSIISVDKNGDLVQVGYMLGIGLMGSPGYKKWKLKLDPFLNKEQKKFVKNAVEKFVKSRKKEILDQREEERIMAQDERAKEFRERKEAIEKLPF